MTARAKPRRSQTHKRSNLPQRELTLYTRNAVCRLCGIDEQQLTIWESEELVTPQFFEREPVYDAAAMRRIRLIRTLGEELEVNVPGISVILRLLDQLH